MPLGYDDTPSSPPSTSGIRLLIQYQEFETLTDGLVEVEGSRRTKYRSEAVDLTGWRWRSQRAHNVGSSECRALSTAPGHCRITTSDGISRGPPTGCSKLAADFLVTMRADRWYTRLNFADCCVGYTLPPTILVPGRHRCPSYLS
jgi:hypothetical protein